MPPKHDKVPPGHAKRDEAHKRNDERKAEREANKLFVYTNDEGEQQDVRISEDHVAVYPADGTPDAAFIVFREELTEADEDAEDEA
jgi:hypothetical protein